MKTTALATLLAVSLPFLVAAKPTIKDFETRCTLDTDAAPIYIGEHKNVLVQTGSCPSDVVAPVEKRTLEARQVADVCNAACNTNCFSGTTAAPTTSDCHVIADALLYESQPQNSGASFNVASGTSNQVVMTFGNCKTFFLNQNAPNTLSYCRSSWSQLIDWLSTDCSAINGDHGGNCVAADGRWFVQVQGP
jgi:hypothetical protein